MKEITNGMVHGCFGIPSFFVPSALPLKVRVSVDRGCILNSDQSLGWDQTGSNGANLSFPAEFGIDSGSDRDSWIVGAVNAIIFLSAGCV